MEARFKDVEFARKAYTKVVKRFIDAGVRASPHLLLSLCLLSVFGGPLGDIRHMMQSAPQGQLLVRAHLTT